jgi:uncharacterized protein YyaL (SSP411 family)
MRWSAGLWIACLATSAGCVRSSGPAAWGHGTSAPATDGTAPGELAWADLNAETFARARAEGRIVLIDGSAEWCHWCHVMEATTYGDPEVRKLLGERFLPVKVDVDTRPDFEERYEDWGWPATVLMTADAEEIGKFRGYIPPAKFLDVLRSAAAAPVPLTNGSTAKATAMQPGPLSEAQVTAAASRAQRALDSLWDPKEGSWGDEQKVPLYWDNAWALAQATAGDDSARKRALFTLDQQRPIIDPVWGGICQYSTNGDWLHPHYEKLTAYQAGAIDNYATAFALTRDEHWLATAQLVRGFVDHFMTGPEGGFYATMDADLNAHDASKPFVSGHEYYAKDDAARRALGIPRVDSHEYGRENGLVIASYVTLGMAAHDSTAIATAERAAARILATHATRLGGIAHAASDDVRVLYLADNAAFGFALVRLYEATHDSRYLESARPIAEFLLRELQDSGGGFLASTPDPTAMGVLAARRKPFEDNVMAIRFLARLSRFAPSDTYRSAIGRALAVVGTQDAIDERGRMLGDLLLAIEESKYLR